MSTARQSSLIRLGMGVGGLAASLGVVVVLAMNFLIIQPVIDVIGAEGIGAVFPAAGWLIAIGSVVVVAAVLIGWYRGWLPPPRGFVVLLIGLGLYWGERVLSREFDVWGLNISTMDVADAQYQTRLIASEIVWLAAWFAALIFTVMGAVRVLRSPVPVPVPVPGLEAEPQSASKPSAEQEHDQSEV